MKAPLLLLLLAALLSWGSLRLDAIDATQSPVVAAERRQPPPPTAPNAEGPRVIDASAAALAHTPLFRPAALPAALQAPQPGETFALVGMAGERETRVAFLRDQADGRTFTVRAGESVRGWTIEEADDRCVTLRRARRRQNACLS